MAKTEAVDLGRKLAAAFTKLTTAGRVSPDMHLFVLIDTVSPHQLSVEDLAEITHLDRGTIAPLVSMLVKMGYVQERGGLISRAS